MTIVININIFMDNKCNDKCNILFLQFDQYYIIINIKKKQIK